MSENTKDDGGNAFVDFVWGNLPMQPDEGRTVPVTARAQGEDLVIPDEAATLDPALDDHDIAVEAYVGYPELVFVQVPDIRGLSEGDLADLSLPEGLTLGDDLSDYPAEEKVEVMWQYPAPGAKVHPGEIINYKFADREWPQADGTTFNDPVEEESDPEDPTP